MTKKFQSVIGCLAVIQSVLSFDNWYLFEFCILVLGIFMIFISQKLYLFQAISCLNDAPYRWPGM